MDKSQNNRNHFTIPMSIESEESAAIHSPSNGSGEVGSVVFQCVLSCPLVQEQSGEA